MVTPDGQWFKVGQRAFWTGGTRFVFFFPQMSSNIMFVYGARATSSFTQIKSNSMSTHKIYGQFRVMLCWSSVSPHNYSSIFESYWIFSPTIPCLLLFDIIYYSIILFDIRYMFCTQNFGVAWAKPDRH